MGAAIGRRAEGGLGLAVLVHLESHVLRHKQTGTEMADRHNKVVRTDDEEKRALGNFWETLKGS